MRRTWVSLVMISLLLITNFAVADAEPIGRSSFRRVWERNDYPIQQDEVRRPWLWGPTAISPVLQEWYLDSPGDTRAVQYFDKGRMEINNPGADPTSLFFVTSGLLVNEMITGRVQVGNNRSIRLPSAAVSVAGDPGSAFPTYSHLFRLYNTPSGYQTGDHVVTLFEPTGLDQLTRYAESPATEIVRIERRFGIPRVFWDYLNRTGTIYRGGRYVENQLLINWRTAMGWPVTDPVWTRVKVGGIERDVLIQAFERRLLTYTPTNARGFQVELSNVGRHYYRWRYINPFSRVRTAVIGAPRAGALVTSPLVVQGFENGTAFEAAITIRLRSKEDNTILARANTTVHRPDIRVAGPFEATLNFVAPDVDTPATLEIVTFSAENGAATVIARLDVVVRGVDE